MNGCGASPDSESDAPFEESFRVRARHILHILSDALSQPTEVKRPEPELSEERACISDGQGLCRVHPVCELSKPAINGLRSEKNRRVYYQDIVYSVCNALDRIDGRPPGYGIVCGTFDSPSTEVQERMKTVESESERLRGVLAEIREQESAIPAGQSADAAMTAISVILAKENL